MIYVDKQSVNTSGGTLDINVATHMLQTNCSCSSVWLQSVLVS